MKTKRGIYQKGALALAALSLCVAGVGCKIPTGSDQDQAEPQPTAAPPDPGVVPTGDIVRYAGLEVNDPGQQSSVRQAIVARKGADYTSASVATLYPGTMVTRVAHYGNYSLVAWTTQAGPLQGWVDTNLAFNIARLIVDAGTTQPVTAPTVATTPTTPPAVTTAAPPPTTTPPATVTPPPVRTITPPPVRTVTPPPVKTTPTPTTTGRFRPPPVH